MVGMLATPAPPPRGPGLWRILPFGKKPGWEGGLLLGGQGGDGGVGGAGGHHRDGRGGPGDGLHQPERLRGGGGQGRRRGDVRALGPGQCLGGKRGEEGAGVSMTGIITSQGF